MASQDGKLWEKDGWTFSKERPSFAPFNRPGLVINHEPLGMSAGCCILFRPQAAAQLQGVGRTSDAYWMHPPLRKI